MLSSVHFRTRCRDVRSPPNGVAFICMSMGTRHHRQRQEDVEKECAGFHAVNNGRPSLSAGIYFRLLLLGYFEGIPVFTVEDKEWIMGRTAHRIYRFS